MQILRFADLPEMAWKNGGGTTVEYAVCPEGAGLDDFSWRISRAKVERHGPFSAFPGIDRTLAVVSGAGIDLAVAHRLVRLDRDTPPFGFAADEPIEARLIRGPIEDLNVMSRRGFWRHTLIRHRLAETRPLAVTADVTLIVALGAVAIDAFDEDARSLGDGDAAIVDGPATLRLTPGTAGAAVLVAELHHRMG
ncbi:HutD family protein [Siculibacillus lacustris]|uniref:HutD family protein n=1 Tax=Siculibacillus lacustris TaxID=1549641 RepID=A0A4Q9VXD1_9HYPH|nr:HutD family protein [Siculibacillus lacustris]TBW41050.1 HutD family protein [Siculibacillus lacustris]